MITQTSAMALACAATICAALSGYAQPPVRGKVRGVEPFLFIGSLALGFALARDPLQAIAIATLFPGAYYAFGEWKNGTLRAKWAFHYAFFGAGFFFYSTCHDVRALAAGALVIFGGPRAAQWLTARTHQQVGLALIVLAFVFQLTRVPFMLLAS